ncbi:MAG: hypothetical protein ACLQLH_01420 [Terracidiphilus sp.]
MPDVSTKTQVALDPHDPAVGAAAELAALQTKAQVSAELPSSFPYETIADAMKNAASLSGKIAKYGGELAEDADKLKKATELLGDLATTFTKIATAMTVLSVAFAVLGAVMGFLNSLFGRDPTTEILKAIQGLSEQMARFQNYVEVELAELKQDVAIGPKLQTVSETGSKLKAIQRYLNKYAEGGDVEIPRAELVRCEDPTMLAQEFYDACVSNDGINPSLLQLLYDKTYGDPSRLTPMIYQYIALMMTALTARTLRSCIEHQDNTGEAPDEHLVWRFAQDALDDIGPLAANLSGEGKRILLQCESDLDLNYHRKLQSLFPRISVRAADETTHSQAAITIADALKGYPQYLWNVLVYKDVGGGESDWHWNSHYGSFDGFFRQECKDGKACIVVVKSSPQVHAYYFLKELKEHEWPLPKSVLIRFAQNQTMPWFRKNAIRALSFQGMDLREWSVAVNNYASQVPGGKVLYLGIVKAELNPACATTSIWPSCMRLWCPLHVEFLGAGDNRETPIKLICVAEDP